MQDIRRNVLSDVIESKPFGEVIWKPLGLREKPGQRFLHRGAVCR